MQAIKTMWPSKNVKQVWVFLGLVGYYWKFMKTFAQITKLLTTLTHHDAKFDWTSTHQAVFINLKGVFIQVPILLLSRPCKMMLSIHGQLRWCLWSSTIIGTPWSGANRHISLTYINGHSMKMDHSQTRSLWGILCHNQMELLSPGIIMHNDCKPLQKFLNGKNANNKVNQWSLKLATYNTIKWISGAWNESVTGYHDYWKFLKMMQQPPASL